MRFILSLALLITGLSYNSTIAQTTLFSNHTISFNTQHASYSNSFDSKGLNFGFEYKNTLFKNFGLVAAVDKRFVTLESNNFFDCGLTFCGPAFPGSSFWNSQASQTYSADAGINYNLSFGKRHAIILSSGYHFRNIKGDNFFDRELDQDLHGTFFGFEYAIDISHLFAIGIKGKLQSATADNNNQKLESKVHHIGTSFTYSF